MATFHEIPDNNGIDLTPRLQEKIQNQAEELASLYASLQRSTGYSKLCEKRLLELSPSHQLPVTLSHLHDNENSRPPLTIQHSLKSTSHNAMLKKNDREVNRQLSSLTDKVRALELVRSDLGIKLKECRSQLQSKEKIANSLTRTNFELSTKLDELKSRISSSGVISTHVEPSSRNVSQNIESHFSLPLYIYCLP